MLFAHILIGKFGSPAAVSVSYCVSDAMRSLLAASPWLRPLRSCLKKPPAMSSATAFLAVAGAHPHIPAIRLSPTENTFGLSGLKDAIRIEMILNAGGDSFSHAGCFSQ